MSQPSLLQKNDSIGAAGSYRRMVVIELKRLEDVMLALSLIAAFAGFAAMAALTFMVACVIVHSDSVAFWLLAFIVCMAGSLANLFNYLGKSYEHRRLTGLLYSLPQE